MAVPIFDQQQSPVSVELGGGARAVTQRTLIPWTSIDEEYDTIARWQPILAHQGIPVLGPADLLGSQGTREYGGILWQLEAIDGQEVEVPEHVADHLLHVQLAGLPFSVWYYGTSGEKRCLIGAIRASETRAVHALLGAWLVT